MFYVRIGGALMAPFFWGWCIRGLVLCDCVTWGYEGLALTRMLELWH